MDESNLQHLLPLLERNAWFRGRSPEFKSDMLDIASVSDFETSESIFQRNALNSGVYAVLSGSVKIFGVNREGKEALLTFIEPVDWFGELALFDGDVRTHNAVASSKTQLLCLRHDKLNGLLAIKPSYWRDFGVLMSGKLRTTFHLMEDLALLPAKQRVVKRLVLMVNNAISGEYLPNDVTYDDLGSITLNVDQASFAAMLSISRQTANQILKDLESDGVLKLDYGHLTIIDALRLSQILNG